jgi:hypothetical protein
MVWIEEEVVACNRSCARRQPSSQKPSNFIGDDNALDLASGQWSALRIVLCTTLFFYTSWRRRLAHHGSTTTLFVAFDVATSQASATALCAAGQAATTA